MPPPSSDRIKTRLTNKAVHYLGRYASTTARLRQVLQRFAARKLPEADPQELARQIEAVIAQSVQFGYVNDHAFIEARIKSGRTAGLSKRQIISKLLAAGIEADMARQALNTEEGAHRDQELKSALIHIRKKRLGPYSKEPVLDLANKQKQMAKLARAGFSLVIIKKVLGLETIEDAQDLETELDNGDFV